MRRIHLLPLLLTLLACGGSSSPTSAPGASTSSSRSVTAASSASHSSVISEEAATLQKARHFALVQGYTDTLGTARGSDFVREMTDPTDVDEALKLRQGTLAAEPVCAIGSGDRWTAVFRSLPEDSDHGRVLQLEGADIGFVHQSVPVAAWCPTQTGAKKPPPKQAKPNPMPALCERDFTNWRPTAQPKGMLDLTPAQLGTIVAPALVAVQSAACACLANGTVPPSLVRIQVRATPAKGQATTTVRPQQTPGVAACVGDIHTTYAPIPVPCSDVVTDTPAEDCAATFTYPLLFDLREATK